MGRLRLEITADCEDNPMIDNREHAAQILNEALHLRTASNPQPLSKLSTVTMEERSEFDPTSPAPPDASDVNKTHNLLTACWEWEPGCQEVQFEVPKGSKHDVLLWVTHGDNPEGDSRWMMLLGGDVTPAITIPNSPLKRHAYWIGIATVLLLIIAVWRRVMARRF